MSANAREEGRNVPPVDEGDVMASVDRSGDDPTYVVADVSVDDAWVTMPAADAPTLAEWR